MSKILAAILLVTIVIISLPALAGATSVSSTDLIEKAKELDGQEIVFTGEVIGDIMVRGGHTWVNVSDGINAVGIWADNQILPHITLAGRYKVHGDEVKITGVFNRACPEHGGDLDIHAAKIELMKKGYAVDDNTEPWKLPAAVVLALAAVILFAYMVKRQRGHKQ
jgi:hypothetical protein